MKHRHLMSLFLTVVIITIGATAGFVAAATLEWNTVVNNNDIMPNAVDLTKKFNSYNQPSVNENGLVVFRARSKGPMPNRGIYTRDMSTPASPVDIIADGNSAVITYVPYPNNLASTFNEFPSIPRIHAPSNLVATRGQSEPVWRYMLPDETETRVGTTGVYMNAGPDGELITAASQAGVAPGFEYFEVPGAAPGTKFNVFPGAPSPTVLSTGETIITFKGNYSEGESEKTGVFYRDVVSQGGLAPVELIANSDTVIPNLPEGVTVTFGSTAPPSAAGDTMVFVAWDNEEDPTYGGIYAAPLSQPSQLTTLVGLGSPVPGVKKATFTQLGDGLTFDGRFVGFWGAWGEETETLILYCPTEGNKDRNKFCNENPDTMYGFAVEIPVNQGIFIHDRATGQTVPVARTGRDFDNFIYYNYTGAPPGMGQHEGDKEPPRWRSSAYVAISAWNGSNALAVFKARKGVIDPVTHTYLDTIDGLYGQKQKGNRPSYYTILDTTMPGLSLDPEAPADSIVTELGLERDGFRGEWLVINASMLVPGSGEESGMAGIYALSRAYSGD